MANLHPTLKEVFEKAIPAYEEAIEHLKEQDEQYDWISYLYESNMIYGICKYCYRKLNIDIYALMSAIKPGNWFTQAWSADSKQEAIDLLQKRVDRMKELLNQELWKN